MALNIGDKFGCLIVMDNGEEFNNSDYYKNILQKMSELEQMNIPMRQSRLSGVA